MVIICSIIKKRLFGDITNDKFLLIDFICCVGVIQKGNEFLIIIYKQILLINGRYSQI